MWKLVCKGCRDTGTRNGHVHTNKQKMSWFFYRCSSWHTQVCGHAMDVCVLSKGNTYYAQHQTSRATTTHRGCNVGSKSGIVIRLKSCRQIFPRPCRWKPANHGLKILCLECKGSHVMERSWGLIFFSLQPRLKTTLAFLIRPLRASDAVFPPVQEFARIYVENRTTINNTYRL